MSLAQQQELSKILDEARDLLAKAKSQASMDAYELIIRLVETLHHGAPKTPRRTLHNP